MSINNFAKIKYFCLIYLLTVSHFLFLSCFVLVYTYFSKHMYKWKHILQLTTFLNPYSFYFFHIPHSCAYRNSCQLRMLCLGAINDQPFCVFVCNNNGRTFEKKNILCNTHHHYNVFISLSGQPAHKALTIICLFRVNLLY